VTIPHSSLELSPAMAGLSLCLTIQEHPGKRLLCLEWDPGPYQAPNRSPGVQGRPPVTLRGGVLQGVPPSSDRWQRSDHIIARAAIGVVPSKDTCRRTNLFLVRWAAERCPGGSLLFPRQGGGEADL
jgi:hypothetical protein